MLCEDVYSKNTLPVFRASAFDGIAVDFDALMAASGNAFPWRGAIPYVRADTGDDFPDEYDTVIAIEEVEVHGDGTITITPEDDDPIRKGQYVRPAGATLAREQLLAHKGTRITPLFLALLATGGVVDVPVYQMPAVAYIPTGNELTDVGKTPLRGQNVESNSILLGAMLGQYGARMVKLPIVRDQEGEIGAALEMALSQADIVIVNGGSSKGSEDYAGRLLERRCQWFQHGIRCIPGIPIAMGLADGKPVINLPGPTLATFNGMDWLVQALVCRMLGQPMPRRRTVLAALEQDVKKPPHNEMYYRLAVKEAEGGATATVVGRGAGFAQGIGQCNAIFIAPIGVSGYKAGDVVEAEMLY